jgi:hypothetical protein
VGGRPEVGGAEAVHVEALPPRVGHGDVVRHPAPDVFGALALFAYLLVNSILYPSAGGGSVSSIEIGVVCSERYLRATLGTADAPGA